MVSRWRARLTATTPSPCTEPVHLKVDAAPRARARRRTMSCSDARDLSVYYGDFRAVRDVTLSIRRNEITALDRSVGLRQDHVPALPEPHERSDRRRARRGHDPVSRRRPVRRRRSIRSRCVGGSAWCSRSRTRSRSRSTTTSRSARRSPGFKGDLDDLVEQALQQGRPVGRGEGQAEGIGDGAVGRPAAAAVHRARDRDQARRDLDGRAVLGARPDRHGQDRGPDARAACPSTRS